MDRLEFIKTNLTIQDYFNQIILEDLRDYYDGVRSIEFDNRFIRCPFHNEEEGSFKVYQDTNSFYCFGCGAGGDVINMHKTHLLINRQKVESFDVTENFLFNLAKDIGNGKTRIQVQKAKENNIEIINTKQDFLRFTVEINKLIDYLKRNNPSPKEYAIKMHAISVYRDCVLEQQGAVNDAVKELRELILKKS